MDKDPISPVEAKHLIRAILDTGDVVLSKHFDDEALKDGLTVIDAESVLRGGIVREPEWENGSWRYQVETQRIRVVVCFDDETTLILVTIMRLRR